MNAATIGLLLTGFAVPLPSAEKAERAKAPAGFEKVYELKVADLEEFTIKEDKFSVNNVLLKEAPDGRRGQAAIRFAATVRNRSKSYESVSITLIGYDDKKNPLWVSKASTSIDGNWIGMLYDYETSVSKGTLKATQIVWVKVTVSSDGDDD